MSSISPIGTGIVGRVEAVSGKVAGRDVNGVEGSGVARRGEDRVEVSELSRLISKLNALPPVRQNLVDQVRAEIAAGTYETPDRIDLALDGLIDEIGGGF